MDFLVGLLAVAAVIGSLVPLRWYRQQQVQQLRNQAQLRVIEGQLAAFRAALRIQVAEHFTRQRMQRVMDDGVDAPGVGRSGWPDTSYRR
jgi:hypothetical protein